MSEPGTILQDQLSKLGHVTWSHQNVTHNVHRVVRVLWSFEAIDSEWLEEFLVCIVGQVHACGSPNNFSLHLEPSRIVIKRAARFV